MKKKIEKKFQKFLLIKFQFFFENVFVIFQTGRQSASADIK